MGECYRESRVQAIAPDGRNACINVRAWDDGHCKVAAHDRHPGDRWRHVPDDIPSSDFSHVRSVSSTSSVPVRIRMVPCTRLGGTPTSP